MSETEQTEAPSAALKEDPEALVLRGRPRPVIRFRRGLIVGVTGAATAALVGLAWVALEPPSFRFAGGAEEPLPVSKAAAEGLADAPATYADVPKLGPPLPGDLGRPILDRQRELGAPESGEPSAGVERERSVEAERQRLAAEAQAARASGVMVQLAKSATLTEVADAGQPAAAALPPVGAIEPTTPPPSAGQARQLEFAHSTSGDVNPFPFTGAPAEWMLSAGTVIPAALVTGLDSDLPGMVIAQVTEPVRDCATGQAILIPQGARLIGAYDSLVAFGQRRALLIWQRIVFPDGSSVRLDNMPATDAAGYAGLEDKVDFHTWGMLKGIVLSSLLGVGSQLSFGSSESDLVRAIRESAQQNGARAGDQIVSRNLDVQPTIRVRPGWPVRAVIHKDLVLKPWRG
jgi:type IV secretion system protein TrbI